MGWALRGGRWARALGVLWLLWVAWAPDAAAQILPPTGPSAPAAPPALPEALTPETVDALLARLTDAEIRAILRDELRARADAQAAEAAQRAEGLVDLRERFAELIATIGGRIDRWRVQLSRLDQRGEQIQRRLDLAADGVQGMLISAGLILFAAVAFASFIHAVLARIRSWLKATDGSIYWERVVRTGALAFVELAPVLAFSAAIWTLTPLFGDRLGPLQGGGISYIWIFQTGVSFGWSLIVISRRVNAPDAPQLRLAASPDREVRSIHRMTRYGTIAGVGGWLLAGLSPTFGLGFAPAMISVAIGGTLCMAFIILGLVSNRNALRAALASFRDGADQAAGATSGPASVAATILIVIAPWLMVAYLVFAYFYWLLRWLETGQLHLMGPLGTVLVWLLLPAVARMGDELVASLLSRSQYQDRFVSVLRGARRVVLSLAAALIIARLWGVNLLAFVKGPDAPAWASALFDIVVAVLIGQLIWKLVQAALYREVKVHTGDLEDQTEEVAAGSRLDTLIPLMRSFLLIVLTIVVMMIVLSSLGVDIGPLLASAGIIGIAIGFGAQALVRDIFSGMFFLIDDAFRIGEYIELEGDIRGEVQAISIRSLQLRHHRGAVLTIPFGELKNVTNYSRDWVIYKMSFRLEPDTDPAAVKKIVKRIGFELIEDPEHGPKFLEPLKSQGVYMIDDDSALVMRVKFKSKPRMQFVLRREVFHRLRAAFAAADIRFARRKVEVVGGEADAAAAAAADGPAQPSTLATATQGQ